MCYEVVGYHLHCICQQWLKLSHIINKRVNRYKYSNEEFKNYSVNNIMK